MRQLKSISKAKKRTERPQADMFEYLLLRHIGRTDQEVFHQRNLAIIAFRGDGNYFF